MGHKENFDIVRDLLKSNYTSFEGHAIPKKEDLTFDNRYKKVKNAVCVYLDMRHSRKIMYDQNEYRSLKTHRAFLQSFISCMDMNSGKFRSFNGDGALCFFTGENATSRAVHACMNFNKYMIEMNNILREKSMLEVDFGIGVSRGDIYVAKTGKKGAGSTRQDLVWVGDPTYLAVELSDHGEGDYHLWITDAVLGVLQAQHGNYRFNVLTTDDDSDGIWTEEHLTLSNGAQKTAYKTNYYFTINLTD